jgi:hypothetical protein
MSSYPKHYLADVPQELRLKVLDLCIHRQWQEALDLLHQNGFTQYEWYELVWFHDHAPTNLEPRSADGPSASQHVVPPLGGPANPETLTVGRVVPNAPNLNGRAVKLPKPRSKIGRLPKAIQDNLNTMLANGCPYSEIIRCLNDHGYPGFNKVNLHTWKQTGLLKRTDNPEVLEGDQKVSEGGQKPVEGDTR